MAEQCDTKAWLISLAEQNWKNWPPQRGYCFGRTGLSFGRKKWLAPSQKCPRNAYVFRNQYTSYENALKLSKFTTLEVRREKLCLKFAKACLKVDKLKDMFPLEYKDHNMDKRNYQKFKINHAKTERYNQSSIPYLQRLLNNNI